MKCTFSGRGPSSTKRATQTAMHLVTPETNCTGDFLKLRNSEADKVRCGQKHFETRGVPFSVAVSADKV